jgi:hypothetical protein
MPITIWAQYTHEAIIGTTQYDQQSIGSSGNRIAVDYGGGIHVVWMNSHPYPGVRDVYYNYRDIFRNWLAPGQGIDISNQHNAGFPQISIKDYYNPAVVFHTPAAFAESLFFEVDTASGSGNFQLIGQPPNWIGDYYSFWPQMTIDRQGRIHIVTTQPNNLPGDPMFMAYTSSTDGGVTWSAPRIIDTVTVVSVVITSSPVSDKVAIVYCDPSTLQSQVQNDITYIESPDGQTWDFENGKVNITNYSTDSDSIWAFTDCDAVYDFEDCLQIAWDARAMNSSRYYYDDRLLHYDSGDGGYLEEITRFGQSWPAEGCDFGKWNWSIAKMSIASVAWGGLYVEYTSWDSTDCSLGGYANGDIYVWIAHYGNDWRGPFNLTRTHSPGCAPGDCMSEHWGSMVEHPYSGGFCAVELAITYILDKDAGAISQLEGALVDNYVMYRDTLTYETGIEEHGNIPASFWLIQNYPNPFNSETTIKFNLQKRGNVKLEIYDILGSRVATVLDENREAGSYAVNWNANGMASGVYYYKLTTKDGAISKQMVLVK